MTIRTLKLADGCSWCFSAANPQAESFVTQLSAIMQLHTVQAPPTPNGKDVRHLVLEAIDKPKALEQSLPGAIGAVHSGEPAHCQMDLVSTDCQSFFTQLMLLTALFGAEAQTRGGILVHGALAARRVSTRETYGVLLAAPGGTGKTTASKRLPTPWVSLCDDTSLVVRDSQGDYWAHPMPTWSRFFGGGSGGSWNVHKAVRLRNIFFLEQAAVDQVVPLGAGHAAAALVQSITQASHIMTRGIANELARALRSEWFENASALTRRLPSFHLRLTLTGTFWEEIERCLNWDSDNG